MIIVKFEEGEVTEVTNIPDGMTVEVRNYDIEGYDGPIYYDEDDGDKPYYAEHFTGGEL